MIRDRSTEKERSWRVADNDKRRKQGLCIQSAAHGEAYRGGRCEACWNKKLAAERRDYAKRAARSVRDTLLNADHMRRRFGAGIFPRGGGDLSHFRRMERMGLLRFVGHGRDIDHEVEHEVLVFELTPAGDEALAALRHEVAA